jgi:transcriptional regulator of arginine metabolism
MHFLHDSVNLFVIISALMKRLRHKAILDLVRTGGIASQEELLEGLLARKIEVSQSTLSRDIQELRLAKAAGVYTFPGHDEPSKDTAESSLRWIVREFLEEIAIADTIVVLKTGSGHASTVSQAIDEAGWPETVGSIAGENTVFIAVRSIKDGRKVERKLREFLE